MDKMTINKQDLIARIQQLEKQQEGIAAELKDLSGMIQNLPYEPEKDFLDFKDGERFWVAHADGIFSDIYYDSNIVQKKMKYDNKLFKSERMARIFSDKTQFIADCLFWKELYDRDFVPDWVVGEMNWAIVFDHMRGKYEITYYSTCGFDTVVFFSSEEIAQGLADWLNRKREKNEDTKSV